MPDGGSNAAVECCEFCGDDHYSCDNCGAKAASRRCVSCGSLVCEIEAMHVGDAREARGLPRSEALDA